MPKTKKMPGILSLKFSRTPFFVFLFITATTTSFYVAGMLAGLLPSPSTCATLVRQTIVGPDGATIETVLTNCDLIAKWERVSISGKQRGDLSKTRLFEYDPVYDTPLPQIAFYNDKEMIISVQAIDSIVYQRDIWNGRRLSYRIGKTYYPDPALDSFVSRLTNRSKNK